MNNRTLKFITNGIFLLLFLLSCFFMYDFYKCLSGFVANGFREPFMMLPLIISYLAPVIAFLFFFYDNYIKTIKNNVKVIYVCVILVLSIFNIVGIIANFSVYSSNNALGVYESLYGLFIRFPYDAIVINTLLVLAQAYNIFGIIKPESKVVRAKDQIKQNGTISLGKIEYSLLCLIAIVSFVFIGSGLGGFVAIENALYDGKYIFLMLWVFLVPLVDLFLLTYKVEKRQLKKGIKIGTLVGGIALNLIFGILVFVFELTSPDFMIHVGKPLFMIAFSVSLPIEQLAMLIIMAVSTVVFVVRFISLLDLKNRNKETK